jgi:2-amino-4-hydroxy-6-hydroxymethyldihydropteridine diphosphokinase
MPRCLIGLGSNLGDRYATLQSGLERLRSHRAIDVRQTSSFRETEPVGGPTAQGRFLNAATVLDVSLTPPELLAVLQDIEDQLGRVRQTRWDARTIDLDLLLYDELVWNSADLLIPHPRLAWRAFVLEPAAEIAEDWMHPQIGWTVGDLLRHLRTAPNYVAISAAPSSPATRLAQSLRDVPTHRVVFSPSPHGTPRFGSSGMRPPWDPSSVDNASGSSPLAPPFDPPDFSVSSQSFNIDPVRYFQLERQRLRDLADVLRKNGPPPSPSSSPAAWLISDFWLPDSLLSVRRLLFGVILPEEEDLIQAELEQVISTTWQPKLLVQFTNANESPNAELAGIREQFLARYAPGPRLLVPTDDSPRALAETRAAFIAMATTQPS